MLKLPLSLLSPAGTRGRLSILIFHRVLSRVDPLLPDIPDAAEFAAQMAWVREWFNVLPLTEAARRLYDGSLPTRAMSITFDDGYADNEELAAPILRRLGLNATFFVSTGFLDGGCMWNDRVIEAVRSCPMPELDLEGVGLGRFPMTSDETRRLAIGSLLTATKHLDPVHRQEATDAIVTAVGSPRAPRLMMNRAQVANLCALGMEVGAHTVTHPILCNLDMAAARDEILQGKQDLERILGRSVDVFAYPNGVPDRDYAAVHVALVRDCGFAAAVTTAWGAASSSSDRFQLPRFTPWDRTRLRYGTRLLANLGRSGRIAA